MCGPSVWNLIHLALRILRWLSDFWKIFTPVNYLRKELELELVYLSRCSGQQRNRISMLGETNRYFCFQLTYRSVRLFTVCSVCFIFGIFIMYCFVLRYSQNCLSYHLCALSYDQHLTSRT